MKGINYGFPIEIDKDTTLDYQYNFYNNKYDDDIVFSKTDNDEIEFDFNYVISMNELKNIIKHKDNKKKAGNTGLNYKL